jgi:uncharacterized protein (DUF58 family)
MSVSSRNPEQLLQRLEWTVIRRLDGLLQGDYRTLFRGFGLDLADLREYQLHDDVRHIDWNVTARTQTPYVREHNEDREVTAWFLLDLSPSVDVGSEAVDKRQLLVEFTAVLMRLLTRHGNRVGAIFFGGGADQVIPARGGRRHVLHVLAALMARPRLARAPATDLSTLCQSAANLVRRRSLVFLVSDFVSAPGWEGALSLLARRHEVLAVRLIDPLDYNLPDLGLFVMQDAETGEQLFIDSRDRGFRRRLAEATAAREHGLREGFARADVDVLELSTAEDLGDAILGFAEARRQRGRTAAGAVAAGAQGV